MPVSARDVASALRERHPGQLGKVKLHKLLYYAQGHHLATFGRALFSDTISAWDMGPVVGTLWREEKDGGEAFWSEEGVSPPQLGEGELNTIGYVLSRYGRLSGEDLMHLTHSEEPWQLADRDRRRGERVRIELQWICDYFSTAANDEDEDGVVLDSAEVSRWLEGAEERRELPAREDSRQELEAMLAAARER